MLWDLPVLWDSMCTHGHGLFLLSSREGKRLNLCHLMIYA